MRQAVGQAYAPQCHTDHEVDAHDGWERRETPHRRRWVQAPVGGTRSKLMEHDDASRQQVLSNAHAPVKVCGYAPFGNIPEFYTTFGVKPGDTLHSDIAAAGGTTRCFRNQLSSGTNQPVPPTHATVLDQPPAPVRPTGALVDPVPPKPFGQPTMAKADCHVHAKGDLTLVDRAAGIFANEPIDIYTNPTYIPEQLAADYDRLWTPARITKVVDGRDSADGPRLSRNEGLGVPIRCTCCVPAPRQSRGLGGSRRSERLISLFESILRSGPTPANSTM